MGQEIERVARSLEALYGAGGISDSSQDALLAIPMAAAKVAEGLGETSSAEELLLAAILVDDSPSVAPNVAEIRQGHNLMLDALRSESSTTDVQAHTRALNRGVLSPYRHISQAMLLNQDNFSANKLLPWTPLYLQSLLTLGTVITKAQEEEDRGARIRTFTLIITDGEDNRSGGTTANHVRAVVTDMLEFSTNHIVAGMGVGERQGIDFRQVFRSMGIPESWVFTSGAGVDELRAVFRKIATSLRLAAASEAGFFQLAAGPLPD